jgi:hypothetical protein
MIDRQWLECGHCGGEAEFKRTVDGWSAWYGDWERVSHDCHPACQNHPDIDPTALTRQMEEDEVRRAEANYERTLSGDNGPLPLDMQAEQAKKFK